MKTAYELAMERLAKSAPQPALTEAQKKEIAEISSVYSAKLAERDIHFSAQIAQAEAVGDFEAAQILRRELGQERAKLEAEMEAKKTEIRQRV